MEERCLVMEDNIEFWIVVASILFGAGSEIIGISKWKPNSWIQLIINIIGTILRRAAKRPNKKAPSDDQDISREGN
jgi:hypothetical protein